MMSDPGMIVLLTVLLPVIGAGLVLLLRKNENAREAATLLTGALTFAHVLALLRLVRAGESPGLDILEVVPNVWLSFEVEPLGMVFALVAGFLWPVTSLYAIGYMRGHHEENQTRFFFFFAPWSRALEPSDRDRWGIGCCIQCEPLHALRVLRISYVLHRTSGYTPSV